MDARTTIVTGGLAIGIAAAIYGGLHRRERAAAPRAPSTATAAAAVPTRVAWARGVRHVYDVRWEASSRSSIPGLSAPVDGSARFDVELSLGAIGEADGRTILAARVGRVREHALRVMGSDALPSHDDARAAFDGREAFVGVAPDGTFDAVYFAKGSPKAFEHVTTALVSQMQVVGAGDDRASWSTHEASLGGASTVRYAVRSIEPEVVWTRARERYDSLLALPDCDGCAQSLDDRGSVTLDRAGVLRGVDDEETLGVTRADAPALASRSAFHAAWLRSEPFEAPTGVTLDLAALDVRRPGQVTETAAAARSSGGLERDEMIQGLRFYDTARSLDPTFVARAAALVTERPELCAELADAVADPTMGAAGRALALDVLASAETGAAQAAMRRALASPAAKSDGASYAMLLQRFAVLEKPHPESARFVADAFDVARARGDRPTRDAAAYTMGAMAKSLARSGDDPPLARSLDAKLRRGLDGAATPRDRATYLTALGNVGDPGDVAAIEAYAKSDDPAVRAATANALRAATAPDARATVLSLVGDADAEVQTIALGALDAQPISRADYGAVTSQVTSGNVAPANEAGLVTFVAKHADVAPDAARDALVALLSSARIRGDRALMARIKVLLAGV
jgi:hypothetical protein